MYFSITLKQGHNPRLEWSQLPELWPLLESLEVRQCSGLSIDMVSTLVLQLEGLRYVKLPRQLLQQDLERATDIQDYFASKNKPVQIEEYFSASVLFPCPFQLPVQCRGKDVPRHAIVVQHHSNWMMSKFCLFNNTHQS